MKRSLFSYFWGSFTGLVLAVAAGFWIGSSGGLVAGISAALAVLLLSVLETSLSFDNAVVNAAVLKHWNQFWRNLFLWVGLPIAVFGMRLIFPILIVSLTTGLGFLASFGLALTDPGQYAHALASAHHQIAAFGGIFLLMVGFEFFIDAEKREHWIPFLERLLSRLGTYQKAFGAALALIVLLLTSGALEGVERHEFVVAGVLGLIVYVGTKFLGELLSGNKEAGKQIVAQGVGGLLYLEVLDASFSFDGVVGAFALSSNIWIIMLGLGVGALFVRSLTIYLVDEGTLEKFAHLEHGAFWAIIALAVLMLAGVSIHIPEIITGLIGAALIGLSIYTSLKAASRA